MYLFKWYVQNKVYDNYELSCLISISLSNLAPPQASPEWQQCWPTLLGSCCCWGQKVDMCSLLKFQASESWKKEISVLIRWQAGQQSPTHNMTITAYCGVYIVKHEKIISGCLFILIIIAFLLSFVLILQWCNKSPVCLFFRIVHQRITSVAEIWNMWKPCRRTQSTKTRLLLAMGGVSWLSGTWRNNALSNTSLQHR